MKIFSPNKKYDGISAGIKFINGVGETTNPHILKWFEEHGYELENPLEEANESQKVETLELENMSVEELKAYAEKNNIDIGRSTTVEGIFKKIKDSIEGRQEEETDDSKTE